MRQLLFCAFVLLFTPHSNGQEIDSPKYALDAGSGSKLDFRTYHDDSLSVQISTSDNLRLIVATGAIVEGGDGWRIKHNFGIGAEKQLLSGLSLIGFLDYARFDYSQEQHFGPPYRKDPSYTLSIAAMLKVYFPWYVSPYIQAGLGISYVDRGNLYYHDEIHYPPTPETDHVDGGGSVLTYLMNLMAGLEVHPFKELSLFLETGFNGDWQKDRYPANSLARFGIGVGI